MSSPPLLHPQVSMKPQPTPVRMPPTRQLERMSPTTGSGRAGIRLRKRVLVAVQVRLLMRKFFPRLR